MALPLPEDTRPSQLLHPILREPGGAGGCRNPSDRETPGRGEANRAATQRKERALARPRSCRGSGGWQSCPPPPASPARPCLPREWRSGSPQLCPLISYCKPGGLVLALTAGPGAMGGLSGGWGPYLACSPPAVVALCFYKGHRGAGFSQCVGGRRGWGAFPQAGAPRQPTNPRSVAPYVWVREQPSGARAPPPAPHLRHPSPGTPPPGLLSCPLEGPVGEEAHREVGGGAVLRPHFPYLSSETTMTPSSPSPRWP